MRSFFYETVYVLVEVKLFIIIKVIIIKFKLTYIRYIVQIKEVSTRNLTFHVTTYCQFVEYIYSYLLCPLTFLKKIHLYEMLGLIQVGERSYVERVFTP